jgi:branched-chain amino acid transport system permease protein
VTVSKTERALPTRPAQFGLAAVAVGVLLTLPSIVGSYYLVVASLVVVFMVAGLGLVVLMGWTGQVALAQAGFIGVGAYGTTYLTNHGWPWVPSVFVIACFTAAVGSLIGLPAIRMKGFYLAIATLAFASLMQTAFIEADSVTGGVMGVSVTPTLVGGLDADASRWYVCLGIGIVGLALTWSIGRSALGRSLRMTRDSDVAANSVALSPPAMKLTAFAVSAFLGSLAGSAYAQCLTYLVPESFGLNLMISLLVVTFVGGVTRVVGPLLGALVVVVMREQLQELGSLQNFTYGALLALAVGFLPLGLASLPSRVRDALRRTSKERPGGSSDKGHGGSNAGLDRPGAHMAVSKS